MSTYVAGALVTGPAADFLSRVLHRPALVHLVANLPDDVRSAVIDARRGIDRAAYDWTSQGRIGEAQSGDPWGTLEPAETSVSVPVDWLGTREAVAMLAQAQLMLGPRRMQQIASRGLAVKIDGRWRYDPTSLIDYARRRAA